MPPLPDTISVVAWQMQDLMGGPGVYNGTGKYVHADLKSSVTQIGGATTETKSMTEDWNSPEFFANISKAIAAGADPVHKSAPLGRAIRP